MKRLKILGIALALVLLVLVATGAQRIRLGVQNMEYGYDTQTLVYLSGDTLVIDDLSPVNALWYGVDNTGATDCSDSLQAAIDAVEAAGGGALYLPAGVYTVNADSLTISVGGITVYGDGSNATLIAHAPSTGGDLFVNTTSSISDCAFRDMSISTGANSGYAFDFANVSFFWFERLDITCNASSDGAFRITRTGGTNYYHTFYGCAVSGDATYGWKIDGANDTRIIACRSTDVDTAVHLTGASGVSVTHSNLGAFLCGVSLPSSADDKNFVAFNVFENTPTSGTGVHIPSGSTDQILCGNTYTGLTANVSDGGSNTMRLADGEETQLVGLKLRQEASDPDTTGHRAMFWVRDDTLWFYNGTDVLNVEPD